MKRSVRYISLLPVYIVVLTGFILLAVGGSRVVTVMSENAPVSSQKTVIIDAGHGGEDGGATSCTGVLESQFNLEISQKLNDLLNLLGVDTLMIRTTDCSIYTQGNTIAQKKISDLKERVRIANSTPNVTLLSIHQNHFSDERYSGAQVFYAPTVDSMELAKTLQSNFKQTVNPDSNRQIKKAEHVYLMQHVTCPAVLIECGFISNSHEERLLRDPSYQQKLCGVIACTVSQYLFSS